MCNFKILDITVGEYRVFLNIENLDTKDISRISIPVSAFYFEEIYVIQKIVAKNCPNNLFFESRDLREINVKNAAFERIRSLVLKK